MPFNARRLVLSCVIAGAIPCLGPVRLLADQSTPPAVSVVAFDGPGIAQRDREAMADELAARLVDTHRFRVLPREWLPTDREQMDPTMAALFDSAKSARLDYLIFGTARRYSTPANSTPRSLLLATLLMSGRVSRPAAVLFPALSAGTARVQTVLSLQVRVVDVATADIVRTANSSRSTRAPAPVLMPAATPKLNHDWTKALAEIATTLDVGRAAARESAERHR